jgi:hypothetical protein
VRCSATLLGFLLTALRSFSPATTFQFRRVFSTSVATLPRAVEPRASRDVFSVRHRCRGPVLVMAGMGRSEFFELRLLGFSPAGQPFPCIGAAPPRLGYEGPLRSTNRFCPGLFLFRASRPSNPGSPLPGPIRSWALSSRRSAILRNACRAFTTSCHRFRRLREGALQRLNEFDGLPRPAMFSSGRVGPYEVSHRPRNARRSLFAGQRSPAVTSGATCLEMSFT